MRNKAALFLVLPLLILAIRSTNMLDHPSDVLRVAGINFSRQGEEEGYQAFLKAYPEITVRTSTDVFISAEANHQDFLSSTASDVYLIYNPSILSDLVKQGYCMDLSGSTVLTQAVKKMYPHMTQGLHQDGKLFAVPFRMDIRGLFSYNPSLFEKIGIDKEDVPDTLMELMDFFVDWVEMYADAYPEMNLFDFDWKPIRTTLLELIISQQLSYCQKENIPVTFDTKEMHLLLAKLDEVSPIISALDPPDDDDASLVKHALPNTLIKRDQFLFGPYLGVYAGYEPMQFGLSEDIPMFYEPTMNVLVINPYSKHPEAALAFLEALVNHLDTTSAYMLFEGRNEPIENPQYPIDKQSQDEYEGLTPIERQIAKQTGIFPARMTQDSSITNVEPSEGFEIPRYTVSPESIAHYRSIALNMLPRWGVYSFFGRYSGCPSGLHLCYRENQITGEQFIMESERVLEAIYIKNE